jgi:transcriptional regulator with XRE-family HTH domain
MRRRRITQAQLAERTKLSLGVISRALKDPNRAKVATLRKMATVLDARFADLLQPGSQ